MIERSSLPETREALMSQLRERYADRAKEASLRPWEVAVGAELLSDENDSTVRMRLAMLLFGIQDYERLSVHNWRTFKAFEENDQRAFGRRVSTLRWPLYPPKWCSQPNNGLLTKPLNECPTAQAGDSFDVTPVEV
uniref:Phosphoglycerate kinase n=1 Tax=Lygus hesperus TaxID=30085 RepID=A0A0A9WZZ4_LYGHE